MNSSEILKPLPPPSRRRKAGRWNHLLVGISVFAITVALFYAEEDWRGKRAWLNYKHQLEAEGKVIDWSAYIPKAVPDDQNIFKAPQMRWFVKDAGTNALSEHFGQQHSDFLRRVHHQLIVAELTVIQDATNSSVLRADDPTGMAQARAALEKAVGRRADGAMGFVLVARPLDEFKSIHLRLASGHKWTAAELKAALPDFDVSGGSGDSWSLSLSGVISARDYLAATDPLEPDFELIRRALQRPYSRMDSDYQRPFEAPVPNFVAVRQVVQTLAQRAQCFLLLDQPGKAVAELALIQRMDRFLQVRPGNRPAFLVGAMIDVAINGLYVAVVKDGFRLGVWREPELIALQEQLAAIDLVPLLRSAMNQEVAGVCRAAEVAPAAKLFKLGELPPSKPKPFDWIPRVSIYDLVPRGWMYQNMIVYAKLMERQIDNLDTAPRPIVPHKIQEEEPSLVASAARSSPFTLLAKIGIPNLLKATITTAKNQTAANQAQIACALHRCRLAQGEYPPTLEALVPRYLSKIPHDAIGGEPPRYRRTADGQFLLYSIGWSEQDHGGQAGADPMLGDWVWTTTLGQ